MSLGGKAHPVDHSWVVKVHASERGGTLLGGGVVLDDRRVLTCAHVAGIWDEDGRAWAERETGVWVSFPNAEAGDSERRLRVEWVVLPSGERIRDVAVLHMAGSPPASVPAAPLQCLWPDDLVGKPWRALGFVDAIGEVVEGVVGGTLAHGWIRLDRDQDSRYRVTRGFSGSGLWSPDDQAVVAVVSQEHDETGDGRAVTLYQAARWLPDEGIMALSGRRPPTGASEAARAAWGWSLSGDPEGARHWRTSGRGVSVASERGFRFRGRAAALRAVRDWLDRRPTGPQVLVVTGAAGTGKSAVLGRIVTTADPAEAAQLPASDDGVRATEGSVGCAVHAKGKTALDIAVEIAQAARAAQPVERLEDFEPALRHALSGHRGRRFNVIIDALDEAASPAQARITAEKVILPLAAKTGASVVVGSRRTGADGQDLLGAFGDAGRLVDLDDEEFFEQRDLTAYALVTLQLARSMRSDNPFDDDETAGRAAGRIAGLSGQNFLVAQLIARMLASPDGTAVEPTSLPSTGTVDDAMREFLGRIPPVRLGVGSGAAVLSAGTLLTPLAFAEAPGLSARLWRTALRALGADDVPEPVLTRFARSSPAKFLVESSGGDEQGATFLLSHQALNDTALNARARISGRVGDEAALTRAFLQAGRDAGWDRVPAYLLRSLPTHAARAGLMDDLLGDDDYLLHASLLRVLSVAEQATTVTGRQRARLLRLSPYAALTTSDASYRAAMFGVTEALEGLPGTYRQAAIRVPYRAVWAAAQQSTEYSVLRGHRLVTAVCAFTCDGITHLATANYEGTVRIWDPAIGITIRTLTGHNGRVNDICALTTNGATILATCGDDQTVRIWNPTTGACLRILTGHQEKVSSICALTLSGTAHLASISADQTRIWNPTAGACLRTLSGGNGQFSAVCAFTLNGTPHLAATVAGGYVVRIWDAVTGAERRPMRGHTSRVNAVCAFSHNGITYLATTSDDRTVRIWNPAAGTTIGTLIGHKDRVRGVCAFSHNGITYLATSSNDETVRVWDPATCTTIRTITGRDFISRVCAFTLNGATHLATNDGHDTVRIWNLADHTTLHGTTGASSRVTNVTPFVLNGAAHLATADPRSDGIFRIWHLATSTARTAFSGPRGSGKVNAACCLPGDTGTLLALACRDGTVRIWDPATGTTIHTLTGHEREVNAVCAFTSHGTAHLAAASSNATVRIWNLTTRTAVNTLTGHRRGVRAIHAFTRNDTTYLATAGDDGTARVWDPATGTTIHTLTGHKDYVGGVCTFTHEDTTLLATAGGSADRTVRIWDPADGSSVRTFTGHEGGINAICTISHGDTALLATASWDQTVRIWNPSKEVSPLVIPTRDEAFSVAYSNGLLFVGTATGVLALAIP